MNKHTPGPWYAEIPTHILPEANDPGPYYFIEPKADPINLVAGFHIAAFLSHADARLISAAPDMYQALKNLLSTVEAADNDDAFVRAAQAAVAKAEGGV